MRRNLPSILYIFLLCLFSLASCSGEQKTNNGKVLVVCTTNIVGNLTQQILSKDFEVVNLMGAGVDPHIYKPKPGDIDLLQKADYIVYNGLHLEGKMGEILENFGKIKPVICLSSALYEEQLITSEDFQGGVDPHVWFDPGLWQDCAQNLAVIFKAEFPEKHQAIEERYLSFVKSNAALKDSLDLLFKDIPKEKRVLVTAHDAFSYFARVHDFDLITIQGLSTQTDFSIKTIENISDSMLNRGIACAFFETSIPKKSIETLISVCEQKGLKVRPGGELYSDALGIETPDYQSMYLHNAREISSCLSYE